MSSQKNCSNNNIQIENENKIAYYIYTGQLTVG